MALTRIGHYTIVSELGRGGMGVVYKAHEESLNRFVAIKVLADQLAAEPEFVTRFEREARAAAALSHPNIIQIYYIGEDEGRHFFVMEYVSGRSLLDITRQDGRVENPRAARLMRQAAHGLAAAHDLGMLHRDIKPANIMVAARDLVKIADFGLALPLDTVTRLTATGILVGTPGYLSPEQCMGEKLDRRTDIYSLGVTYYEVLSGRLPFSADSPLALLRKIVDEEPPDIATLNQSIDEATHRIVHRMIAKDRKQRYPDCHELAADLEEYLALFDRPPSRRTVGPVPAAAPRTPSEEAATERLVPGGPGGGSPSATPGLPLEAPPAAAPAAVAPGVAGGQLPPLPSAPVAPTRPGTTEAPVAASAAPAPPAVRRSRAALLAVAVLVVAVAVLAGGGVLLMRSSLVTRLLHHRSETPDRTLVASASTEGASGEAPAAAPSTAEVSRAADETGAGGEAGTDIRDGAPSHPQATEAGAPPIGAAAPGGGARSATGQGLAAARPQGREVPAEAGAVGDRRAHTAPQAAPPAAVARRGVAIASVGETELAGVVQDVLSSDLAAEGVEPQSAAALPELEDLLRPGEVPRTADLLSALRSQPLATLVLAKVIPVGQRQLVYMGRSDVAYSSRIELTAYDLESGRPLGSTLSATVEFTSLNAQRQADQALGPLARELAKRLR